MKTKWVNHELSENFCEQFLKEAHKRRSDSIKLSKKMKGINSMLLMNGQEFEIKWEHFFSS